MYLPGGAAGGQVCRSDGTFDPCICGIDASTGDATGDAGATDASDEPTCTLPSPGVCPDVGCTMAAVALPHCGGDGSDYAFYNADYCAAQLTLVDIVVGWATPCMMEAPMIEEQITSNARYAGRVRVITVVAQGPDFGAPTPSFCQTWQTRYGLTSHMTIDPAGMTRSYGFTSDAGEQLWPVDILVNGDGRIVYRNGGEDIPGLLAAIEANLP